MGVQVMQQTAGTRMARWTVAVAMTVVGVGAAAGAVVLPAAAGAASSPTTVTTAQNKTWGKILVLGNGTTVYRLTTDPKNKSVCKGECAKIWPPVVLAAGQKSADRPRRRDRTRHHHPAGGVHQVTYKGVPLYRFIGDHKSGQATGNIKDTWGKWWVVNPANPRVAPTAVARVPAGPPPRRPWPARVLRTDP